MGEENFRKYPVNFILAGAFSVCIFFFGIGFELGRSQPDFSVLDDWR